MAGNLLLNSPHLLQRLSLSPVMLRLMQEALKPEPDFGVMGETLRLDPALATTVLNLVNSAFYGLPQKVTDLSRAALVLGSREILKVAVSMTLHKDLESGFPECHYDFYPDWRLVTWSSIAAELLAQKLCPAQADQAYLCCLLKDVSLLFLRCAASEYLPEPEQRDRLTVLERGQLDREAEAWGMNHAALSQMLLVRWGIPAEICESVRFHHAVDSLADLPPLAQAVALATQWSEVELGHVSGPFGVVQFEGLLRTVLGLSEREVEEFRKRCLERFRSMLGSLGIAEGEENRAYYRHSVKIMQGFCFLSMDLLTVEGGLSSVARVLGKHIKLNWDVKSWDVALRAPQSQGYRLYHLTPSGSLERTDGLFRPGAIPWRLRTSGLEISCSGTRLGELRLGEATLTREDMTNLSLYLRFFAQGFEHYSARQAVLEEKALAFDAIPVGVARLDAQGRVVEANGRLSRFLSLCPSAKGRPLVELLPSRLPAETCSAFAAFVTDVDRERYAAIDYFLGVDQDGAARDGVLYLSAHRQPDGGFLVLFEDLRELSELEVQTLRRKSFLERLVSSMHELVLTVSPSGVVEYCSQMELGLAGRDFLEVFSPAVSHVDGWGPELLEAEGHAHVEVLLHAQGGAELPYELSFAPLGGKPEGAAPRSRECLVVGRDLTQIRRLEAKLKARALLDGLTGLYNHYQFHATLEREVARSRRTGRGLGLVFFDLDRFKEVNDSKGHAAGDEVLKSVAGLLLRLVRQGMDHPCRYGGDEFAVIVTEVDRERLAAIARRIREDVRVQLRDLVSVSLGFSYLRDDDSAKSLLKRVDNWAYAAKAAGGDAMVGDDGPVLR
ncbi:diguanylate cyclase (GGDEF) domain-containing protein [Humidesulfovibrio mexicanus]|uniref:diguanylate cyclase n=1 Tax=Humidesulfovibrio mexicanus TaxID=147047 RepID=A0A238YD50_9BACT|nr:HDOD domain-containing protein [Humidesulfovibrio mexicanus]SNR68738.1 diguanylate cyclase (GGDEF) domain-containing protein [Humidesulfovibrio mexicanus]